MILSIVYAAEPTIIRADILDTLPSGRWIEIPGSNLTAVAATGNPGPYPGATKGYSSIAGGNGIMESWSGAAYDTTRDCMVVTGGGGSSYAGNELYRFCISTLAWTRITDPSPDSAIPAFGSPRGGNPGQCNSYQFGDGLPVTRHT